MISAAMCTMKSADIADILHISCAHIDIIKKMSRSGVHSRCYAILFVAELSAGYEKVELRAVAAMLTAPIHTPNPMSP